MLLFMTTPLMPFAYLSPHTPPPAAHETNQGDVSLQEQAGLARKTLGAFGFNAITVTGDVCDELFVPSQPIAAKPDLLDHTSSSSLSKMDTLERVQETLRVLAGKEQQEQRWQQHRQQQQQLGVFKVSTVACFCP